MATLRDWFRRFSIGVAVEGVGLDTSKSKGLCFYQGDDVLGATDYEWNGALTGVPRESIADETNISTGDVEQSAFTFELHYNDVVAERLDYVRPRPEFYLSGALAVGGSSVTIVDIDGAAVASLADSVIWCLNEAILLGSYSGGGAYTIANRGFWNTEDEEHVDGEFVYTRNPYNKRRRCELIIYDHDVETEESYWEGFLEPLETNEDGTRLIVRALSMFAAIRDGYLNRGARRIPLAGFTYQTPSGAINLRGRAEYGLRLHKLNMTGSTVPVQAGETLTFASELAGERLLFDDQANKDIGAPSFELEEDRIRPTGDGSLEGQVWKDETFEVFYTDRNFSGGAGGPSSRDLEYPLHPVHLAMGFATSTDSSSPSTSTTSFDAFGGAAGAGLPLAAFDVADIAAVVAEDPGVSIDRLGPLGWNGEAIPFMQVTNEILLRPHGYFWAKTQEGKVTIARRRLATIEDYCTASGVALKLLEITGSDKRRLKRRTRSANQYSAVTADIGALPWREPDKVLIQSRDGRAQDSIRRSIFSSDAERRYDLRTFAPRGEDSDENLELRPGVLLNDAVLGYYGIPTIGVKVLPYFVTGANYGIGKFVQFDASELETAWFLDSDGNRITLLDPASAEARPFIGQIERRRYLVEEGTYELDLLLTNWTAGEVARWRAPVAQVNGNPVSSIVPVYTDAFHDNANDSGFFEVGDIVECWDLDGTQITGPTEIIGIVPSAVQFADDFSASLSGDELIRLANLDDYNSSTSVHIAGCNERVFIYYADQADEQAGGGDETADIYG